ncbi:MAG: hypothetical protein LBJ89_02890 [Holosporales bacterium]|jgi:hypothetical protein|nr:hypothetical protein [Holosporales bacterium]
MKKVFVFIPLCAVFCAMGYSSDDVAVIDELFQKSHATIVQLRELFEIKKAILEKRVNAKDEDDVEAARTHFPPVKFTAINIHAVYCLPLDSMFRNYFETLRLASLESPMKGSAKRTLASLLNEITGKYSSFCQIVDACIVWDE